MINNGRNSDKGHRGRADMIGRAAEQDNVCCSSKTE